MVPIPSSTAYGQAERAIRTAFALHCGMVMEPSEERDPGSRIVPLYHLGQNGRKPQSTMNHFILIAALALTSVASVYAQAPSEQPQSIPVSNDCLLNTNDEVWISLDLSAEQLEQVKSIQTICQTDCMALQEDGDMDPELAEGLLNKHREGIRRLLTKDQYDKWIAWCAERPAKG